MVEQWRSINEIAKELDIPETTARRYLSAFKEYILNHAKEFGRVKKYPEQAVQAIEVIYKMYQEGKTTAEIKIVLDQQFKQVIQLQDKEPEQQSLFPTAQLQEYQAVIKQNNDLIRQNIEAMKQMAEVLTRVLDSEDKIQSLQEEIQELKEELQQQKDENNKSWFKRIFNR